MRNRGNVESFVRLIKNNNSYDLTPKNMVRMGKKLDV